MFPSRSYVHLNSITLLSFILYIFVVAVKTDLSFPRKSRRKALAISEASSLLLPLHLPLPRPLPPHSSSSTTTSPSAGPPSSNIVLFCLLSDLNLLASKIGRIAMNVSLLSDLQGIVLKAILSSLFNTDSHVSVKLTLLSLLSLAVLSGGGDHRAAHCDGGDDPRLLLPGGPPLGTTLADRMERLMEGVFVPVYVAVVGLNADVWSVGDARVAWFTVMMSWWGAREDCGGGGTVVYFGIVLADSQTYTIHVLAVIVIGSLTSPILKLTYNPAKHFINPHKRRSVDQTIPSQELRVLACAHDENNATPLLSLLETSLPNPVCVYLLHLTPLVGQINSVLAPYKPKKHSSAARSQRHTVTDHIVNAFRSLEYANIGSLAVQPFVAVSPFATMHTDICQLAFDSKCALILLPFHSRLAANDHIGLTVIRPVLPQNLRQGNKEEAIDEDAVRAFKAMNAGNKRVDYREEEVKDGEEMIEVVRATSGDYSLVIVGRREGERSRLTEGLEMWSEYPELGVVGDLMASADLGEKVATLVVQQRPTRDVGGETGDAV
ncbi:uncharacterized protein A4U43_C07F23050 [Asparagus officinalis]|uniref:Cation/H+ exchanger domain-containing protein n=1 Tax=Asparagus officinalis TaxID=4686 RepID=A0A5P1EHM0_ASPOF|nr:uncharacterized protein A4U43_C07F23050 [Asparagus officinalis]